MDVQDAQYQAHILERLGEIKFDCTGQQFSMYHEARICGQLVKVPVMVLHVPDGTQDLISDVHLQELQKTPAQRRAEKLNRDINDRNKHRGKTNIKRAVGRGVRMKLALGKFSEEVISQIDIQLLKHTRQEVYRQLQFLAGPKAKLYVDATGVGNVKKRNLKGMSWKDTGMAWGV